MSDALGEVTGSNRQARAAQGAANAQLAESRSVRNQALDIARATPAELRALEGQLTASERQLANAERMFESIDPAILEASDQILKILQGDQTSTGGVYEAERTRQRESLMDTLRAQYGPGAEFTSLGRRALADFDNQTSVGSVGVRDQSLSTLSGIFGLGQNSNTAIGQAAQGLGNAAQVYAQPQNRQLSALFTGSQPVINSSGANFLGDQIKGQAQQQLFNTALQAGGTALAYSFMGPAAKT